MSAVHTHTLAGLGQHIGRGQGAVHTGAAQGKQGPQQGAGSGHCAPEFWVLLGSGVEHEPETNKQTMETHHHDVLSFTG